MKQSSSSECSTVDIVISEEEEMVYQHEKPKLHKNGKWKLLWYFFFKIRLNFSESKYLLLALIMERLHSC